MTTSTLAVTVSKISGDSANSLARDLVEDRVAVEEPLEIRVGYSTPQGRTASSISITMRTPGDDAELAIGFLYSESVIQSAGDILSVDHSGPTSPDTGSHNIIRIDLAAHVDIDLGRLQRNFYTTSSCGVCGKSSLDALRIIGAEPLNNDKSEFAKDVLTAMPGALRSACSGRI